MNDMDKEISLEEMKWAIKRTQSNKAMSADLT